jgi:O-antigen/teichoic acid export membrane protein
VRRWLSDTWPITVCFTGYMLWWALGVSAFIWPVVLVPVLISIFSRGRIRIPRAMVLWFGFLAFVALSGVELVRGTQVLVFLWRWSLYGAAAALFVFVYNLPRSNRLDQRVLHGLTGLWIGVVAGGFLGIVIGGHTFTTPIEHLLPSHLRTNSFVQELVQPVFAQTQSFLGFPVPRPSAPFAYTDQWGGVIAALTPVAFAEIASSRRGPWRTTVMVILCASIVPMVFSLDRGMFLSLLIGIVYVTVKMASAGQRRSLVMLLLFGAAGALLVVATPLGHLVTDSFLSSHGNSNATRLSVSSQAIAGANQSPLLGRGAPQAATTGPTAGTPAIGTQGQLWTVLYTNGYPATVFFIGFFLWVLWQTRKVRDTAGMWLHAVPLVALTQITVYGWLPAEVQIVFVAAALAYRRSQASPRAATRVNPVPLAAAEPRVPSLTGLPSPERDRLPLALFAWRKVGTVALSGDARHVARGSIINVVTMTGGYLFTFALTVLVSRWLGPRSGGVFFELVAMFIILSTILTLGADTGLTRGIALARTLGRGADLRWMIAVAVIPVLVVGCAAAAAVFVASPEMAHVFLHRYPASSVVPEIHLLAVFIPLGSVSAVLVAAARGYGRMWPFLAVEGVTKPVLRLGLVAAALVGGAGVVGAIIGWSVPVCLGAVMAAAILLWIYRSEAVMHRGEAAPTSRGEAAREFWRFASVRGVASTFQVGVSWLDILLVGALLSTFSSGVYAAVSRLAMLGTFALEGTRLAISPHLSAVMARRRHAQVAELYQTATRWLLLASWPLYVLFAIFPGVVLGIFGPQYHAGSAALVVLALAMLVNIGTGNVTVVLLMGGRSSWNLVNTVGALAVNISLNLYLLPRIGLVGAAVAWAASILLDNIAAVVEVWFLFKLSPFGRSYWLTAAIASGTFAVIGLVTKVSLGATRSSALLAAVVGMAVEAALVYRLRDRLQLADLVGDVRGRFLSNQVRVPTLAVAASPSVSDGAISATVASLSGQVEPT